MIKVIQMTLMLCLILSGAFCYANSTVGKGNEKDERPVSIEFIVTFTLSNGDVYAGEFTVID